MTDAFYFIDFLLPVKQQFGFVQCLGILHFLFVVFHFRFYKHSSYGIRQLNKGGVCFHRRKDNMSINQSIIKIRWPTPAADNNFYTARAASSPTLSFSESVSLLAPLVASSQLYKSADASAGAAAAPKMEFYNF
jgi:hypothetical protein